MTAPMNMEKSVGSPIEMDSVASASGARSSFHNDLGTYARDAAEHFCPWYSKAPRSSPTRNESREADSCATTKSLPPVSPTSRGYVRYWSRLSETLRHRCLKVSVEPVKWIPASDG